MEIVTGKGIMTIDDILNKNHDSYGKYIYYLILNDIIFHIAHLQKDKVEYGGTIYCELIKNTLIPFLLVYKRGSENTAGEVIFDPLEIRARGDLKYVAIFFHTHPLESYVRVGDKIVTLDDRLSPKDFEIIRKIRENLRYSTIGLLYAPSGLILYDDYTYLTGYQKVEPKEIKVKEVMEIAKERYFIISSWSESGRRIEFKTRYQLSYRKV